MNIKLSLPKQKVSFKAREKVLALGIRKFCGLLQTKERTVNNALKAEIKPAGLLGSWLIS